MKGTAWATLLLCLGLIAACSGESAASGEVVLYTSMPDAVVERLEGVVEQRFPDMKGDLWVPVDAAGISLTVVRGRTADIQVLIEEEIAAGKVKADLIWLAEPSPYADYKARGLLDRYEPPDGAPIPSEYVDPDGFHVAARVISMVVAWNTDLLPQGLADWPDLNAVGTAAFPAPQSGAARVTIKALIDTFGAGFFREFAAQGGTSMSSNGAASTALAAGTYEAVGVLDYMVRESSAAGLPVAYAYPTSGTVIIPSPIALMADANNPEAARAVADFILSESGQQIIVEIGNFYPVRTDVAPPTGAPPLEEIAGLAVDWAALATEIPAITDFWEELYGPGE
jgi:iron(III) transport system substrate-binding protein